MKIINTRTITKTTFFLILNVLPISASEFSNELQAMKQWSTPVTMIKKVDQDEKFLEEAFPETDKVISDSVSLSNSALQKKKVTPLKPQEVPKVKIDKFGKRRVRSR